MLKLVLQLYSTKATGGKSDKIKTITDERKI